MSNYLIELAIIHLSLIAIYWVFLRNETQYATLRWYLLASTILAILIPLFDIPVNLIATWFGIGTPLTYQIPTFYWLETADFTPADTKLETISYPIGYYAYSALTAGFLFYFLWSLSNLLLLTARSKQEIIQGQKVRVSEQILSSFTFLGNIYIHPDLMKTEEDCLAILAHESAHAKLGHSLDIILFQLFRAAFWWLPTSWFIHLEIKKIHEYQADAYASKLVDKNLYSKILISNTLKTNGLILANSFHDGLTFKRIKAMKNQVIKIKKWKLWAISTFVISLCIFFACTSELDSSQDNYFGYPSEVQESIKDLKVKIGDNKTIFATKMGTYIYKEFLDSLETIYGRDLTNISKMVKTKNDDGSISEYTIWIAGMTREELLSQTAEPDENGIYTMVENPAGYKAGMTAFYAFISSNMKYPKEAKSKGIEGRVYIQFVINEDGSLGDVKTVKGIGYGCDEEAERVLKAVPTESWNPGTHLNVPVKQRMVLPIIFKLDGEVK